jgi:FolB domain-containing protein
MDIVFLRGLRIETTIGIYDWEKQIKQPVVLDLEMGADVAKGAATDRIEDALDYKRVSKRLKEFVGEQPLRTGGDLGGALRGAAARGIWHSLVTAQRQ